jgi:hypothetical protein
MANTGTDFSASGSGLSMPKVRLNSDNPKKIDVQGGGIITLLEYPEIIAMDLSDEQIEQGVYVEMVHYTRGKSVNPNGNNRDSAYKIPVSSLDPFAGSQVRAGFSGAFRTFNHYQVKSRNEVIPVHEYLHNRLRNVRIDYIDTNNNSVGIVVNTYNPNKKYKIFGKSYMYPAFYSPYYFAFRYLTKNDDGTFNTGGLTRVIKMQNDVFPFIVDGVASANFGRQVGSVNPLFNADLFRCQFETKLP